MMSRFKELCDKEVINIKNGCRIGFVDDIEVDTCDARVSALVVYGRSRLFGLLGREEDTIIPWCDIEVLGEDTVLVCCEQSARQDRGHGRKRKFSFDKLFE